MSASDAAPTHREAGHAPPGRGTSSRENADADLAELGYKAGLERSIGSFGSFAAGVSYISILTGTFQLFYFGFGSGGPAYLWSWPIVFVGQLMVALSFAELAGRYPVAGSVYNWSKRVGGASIGWLAGWTMLVASVVTLAAVVVALQATMPQIWSGFQLVGDGTGTNDYAINAIVLGTVLVIFTTVINAFGVKLMARINSAGVFIELIAAVVLIVLLAINITRGPGVVTETLDLGQGSSGGYLGAFLVAALASGYVMYGFDTASSLGEETTDPRKTAPTAILRAVVASFVIGGLILLFAVLAAPDIADPKIGQIDGGLQYIILQVLSGTTGKVFLVCVIIAVVVCSLAVHAAAIRLMFAMARDNNLPGGRRLAHLNPVTKTPVVPAILVGVLSLVILAVQIGQAQIFTVLTSLAVGLIYMAYLFVTVPMLLSRLRGRWPDEGQRPEFFSLGRLGLPINIVAVLWGFGMMLNLLWPRKAIYNAVEPFHWYLQYGAVLFVLVFIVGGFAYYKAVQSKKTGVVGDHQAVREEAAAVGAP